MKWGPAETPICGELNTSKWSQIPFWNYQVGQKHIQCFSRTKNFRHFHTFLDIDIVLEISTTLWTIRSNLVHCDAPARVHAGERSNLHPCPLHTMAFGLSTVLNCMLKAGTCPTRVAEVTLYSTVQPLALLKWFERLPRDASQKRSQKYLYCNRLFEKIGMSALGDITGD